MDGPCAIGRLGGRDTWVGFTWAGDGCRLAVGQGDAVRTGQADADLLLSLAIAYFEDALDDPPPDIEATHADLSALVRHLARGATDPERKRLLDEAVDAIDDGLAVDAVIGRLTAARPETAEEQADPVDLLLGAAASLADEL